MEAIRVGVLVALCGVPLWSQGTVTIPNPFVPANRFGETVAGFADINDDGYADVIVLEPGYGPTQNSNQGRIQVLSGRKIVDSGSPGSLVLYTRNGAATNQSYVSVGKAAGDFNGDGFNDIAFAGSANGGYCEVVSGAYIANLSLGVSTVSTPEILCTVAGDFGVGFGTAMAIDGDFNGDGLCDLAVGQPGGGGGSVSIFLGSNGSGPTMPILVSSLTANPNGFGASLAFSKDLSGDGIDDLLVGSPLGGRLTGFAYAPATPGSPMVLFDTGNPGPATGDFAASVAGLGDVDNDGVNEFAVGVPGCNVPGEVRIMKLVSAGNPGVVTTTSTILGPFLTSRFGRDIDFGSFDGDSRIDLVVGAPGRSTTCSVSDSSQVQLRTWNAGGFSNVAAITISSTPNEEMGRSVANAGDVNADGRDDIIIGTALGQAKVLFGPCVTGGQQNSPLATLNVTIPGNPNFPPTTPYCVPVPFGATIQVQCSGPANAPIFFLTGAANVRAAALPLVGSLDVGTPDLLSDLIVIPGYALGSGGSVAISVQLPFERGTQLPIQVGVVQSTPYPPIVLTAAWYLNVR